MLFVIKKVIVKTIDQHFFIDIIVANKFQGVLLRIAGFHYVFLPPRCCALEKTTAIDC